MRIVLAVGVLGLSYLIGSIPFGLLIVRLKTGKDIRTIESGRTGGTNAMRAAGFLAGAGTAVLDMLKGAVCVWIVRVLLPGAVWVEAFAPVMSILGHNYSIFLISRDEKGQLRLRGGAGGATATGGAFGLWAPSILFIVPIAIGILFGVGYASVATMSVGITAIIIFAIRAAIGSSPWQYIFYGLAAEAVLVWALRPNIRRLMNGTERLVGWRAQRMKKAEKS